MCVCNCYHDQLCELHRSTGIAVITVLIRTIFVVQNRSIKNVTTVLYKYSKQILTRARLIGEMLSRHCRRMDVRSSAVGQLVSVQRQLLLLLLLLRYM